MGHKGTQRRGLASRKCLILGERLGPPTYSSLPSYLLPPPCPVSCTFTEAMGGQRHQGRVGHRELC